VFKWIRARSSRPTPEPEQRETVRDSGEEEEEALEEDDREVGPSELTRVKTDEI
jgi:hypothetical protein